MIVLVDEEGSSQPTGRRFRTAPPVAAKIAGQDWDGPPRERKQLNTYDPATERGRVDNGKAPVNRPASIQSGISGRQHATSGDVSEFSFQLK